MDHHASAEIAARANRRAHVESQVANVEPQANVKYSRVQRAAKPAIVASSGHDRTILT